MCTVCDHLVPEIIDDCFVDIRFALRAVLKHVLFLSN